MGQKKNIRVAFFLPSLEPGGTERNVVNLVNNIDRNKYTISLVLGEKKGDFLDKIHNNVPIINLNTSSSFGLFFKLVGYFKNEKPDIFVSAFPRINIICTTAKIFAKANTKIVITEHSIFSMLPIIAKTFWRGLFARFFMPGLARFFYPKAAAVICVSQGIADDLGKIVSLQNAIKVIYNPVIGEDVYTLAQEPVNHPWFVDLKIPIIIAVGRLVACKGYPTLLNAFSLVLKNQPAYLVILGTGSEKEKLLKIADQLGVSDNTAFLGFQRNPYKYMKRSSVFALSSLQEGFGNVIIEAMASGVPVVSTNCPTGPGEIITNMENGILVPVQDAKSMAEAIMKILDDLLLAEKLSLEGKKSSALFSVKKSVNEYEQVFEVISNAK